MLHRMSGGRCNDAPAVVIVSRRLKSRGGEYDKRLNLPRVVQNQAGDLRAVQKSRRVFAGFTPAEGNDSTFEIC